MQYFQRTIPNKQQQLNNIRFSEVTTKLQICVKNMFKANWKTFVVCETNKVCLFAWDSINP